jgi:hypothetical protein
MQTEQQQSTQTKKSTEGKKVKKSSKPKSEEQSSQAETSVQVETPVQAPAQVEAPVQTESTTVENVVVVQEHDVSVLLESINTMSDTLTESSKYFKDNSLSKDERAKVEAGLKKLAKAFSGFQQAYADHLSKHLSLLEKSAGSKSSAVKKVTDKEKSAIHKKLPVYPFLLSFMKLEPGTLVSRSDALTAITGFVKTEKVANPDIIVENDKRSFKLIGELQTLFAGIEGVMKTKGLLKDKTFPTNIKYTQIMQYMTHCFVKPDDVQTA